MGWLKREILLFSKAQMTALMATVADYGISLFLAEVVGLYYVWATFLGGLSGGIINCSMNYSWVFHAQGLSKKRVVLRYLLVWCGSIGLNTYGTYALTEWSGRYFMFPKIFVAVCVAVLWNYQLQRRFVYQRS